MFHESTGSLQYSEKSGFSYLSIIWRKILEFMMNKTWKQQITGRYAQIIHEVQTKHILRDFKINTFIKIALMMKINLIILTYPNRVILIISSLQFEKLKIKGH